MIQPILRDTITLKKEIVKGFVDRGGVFHEDEDKNSFIAERYVSEYFNVRLNEDKDNKEPDQGYKDEK